MEVELQFEGAKPETRSWEGTRPWERWSFDRSERLLSARVDPDNKLALDANRLNNARRTDRDAGAAVSLSVRLSFWLQTALGWLAM